MYMSGRALYPLTISLALRLSEAFSGNLPVSYSGGAGFPTIEKLFSAGIRPITLATDLLKPGGYQRLLPMAERLGALPVAGAGIVSLPALEGLKKEALEGEFFRKPIKPLPPRKLEKKVPLDWMLYGALPRRVPHRAGYPRLAAPRGGGELRGSPACDLGAQSAAPHYGQHLPPSLRDPLQPRLL
jgi:hypothetical protein